MVHLEEKMRVKFPAEHPLYGWSVIYGAWLLNRYHMASSLGTMAFMSLRGRPYKGRIFAFGEEVFALDPLQAKYASQWRRGIWLSKDSAAPSPRSCRDVWLVVCLLSARSFFNSSAHKLPLFARARPLSRGVPWVFCFLFCAVGLVSLSLICTLDWTFWTA